MEWCDGAMVHLACWPRMKQDFHQQFRMYENHQQLIYGILLVIYIEYKHRKLEIKAADRNIDVALAIGSQGGM